MKFKFRIISLIIGIILICGCIDVEESTNLLKNSGFEAVSDGEVSYWSHTSEDIDTTFFRDSNSSHSGKASACIINTNKTNQNPNVWKQTVILESGAKGAGLELSGFIRTEEVSPDSIVAICIQCWDSNDEFIAFDTTPQDDRFEGTHDWTEVSVTFVTPQTADRIVIMAFLSGIGQVWFDDLQIVVGEGAEETQDFNSTLIKAYGSYIISQKGSEPSGWFKAMIPAEGLVMSWEDGISHTGEKCVSISNEHIYEGPTFNNWAQNIEENMPIGRKIKLSGWIKTENVVGNSTLSIQCFGENYTFLVDAITQPVSGTTSWNNYTTSVTIPEGTTMIYVRVGLEGTGQVGFDDLELRVIETHGGTTNLLKNSGFEEGNEELGEGMISFSPPINCESQAFLGFWIESEPSGYIKEYRFKKDVGQNYVAEVNLKQIPIGEKVKVNWHAYVFTKAFDYSALPENTPISDLENMPEDVKKWLEPTSGAQSTHPEIMAKAKELKGNSNDIMEIARQITDFVGNEIGFGPMQMQDALTTLRTGGAVCTGSANLAAALFRANGIPCRVLAVSSASQLQTHYIVEFYVPDYGWVWMESTQGIIPYQPTDVVLLRVVYPKDEVPSGVPKYTTIDNTSRVYIESGLSETCYQGREILHKYCGDEEEIAMAYLKTKEVGEHFIEGMDLQTMRSVEECAAIEDYIAFLDFYNP